MQIINGFVGFHSLTSPAAMSSWGKTVLGRMLLTFILKHLLYISTSLDKTPLEKSTVTEAQIKHHLLYMLFNCCRVRNFAAGTSQPVLCTDVIYQHFVSTQMHTKDSNTDQFKQAKRIKRHFSSQTRIYRNAYNPIAVVSDEWLGGRKELS